MTPKDFVEKYYPHAKTTEQKSGISALFILAQAAHESAWGASAPGNMFFGVKDTDGINGNEQLLRTSEYLATDKAKFPEIISIKWDTAKKLYHYVVKDYFRKYKTAEESFTDHSLFFFKYKRYEEALKNRSDPYKFAEGVAKAGYATDPAYASKLHKIIDTIKKFIS